MVETLVLVGGLTFVAVVAGGALWLDRRGRTPGPATDRPGVRRRPPGTAVHAEALTVAVAVRRRDATSTRRVPDTAAGSTGPTTGVSGPAGSAPRRETAAALPAPGPAAPDPVSDDPGDGEPAQVPVAEFPPPAVRVATVPAPRSAPAPEPTDPAGPRPAGVLVLVTDELSPLVGGRIGTRPVRSVRVRDGGVVLIGDGNRHTADVHYRIARLKVDVAAFLDQLPSDARRALDALGDHPSDPVLVARFQEVLRGPSEPARTEDRVRTSVSADVSAARCAVVVVGDHDRTHSVERITLGVGEIDVAALFADDAELVRALADALHARRVGPDVAEEAEGRLDALIGRRIRGRDLTEILDRGELDLATPWLRVASLRATVRDVPFATIGNDNSVEVRHTVKAPDPDSPVRRTLTRSFVAFEDRAGRTPPPPPPLRPIGVERVHRSGGLGRRRRDPGSAPGLGGPARGPG